MFTKKSAGRDGSVVIVDLEQPAPSNGQPHLDGVDGLLSKDEIDRLKMRVDAFATYAVLSTLSANLGALMLVQINTEFLQKLPALFVWLICSLTTVCILCGVYAAVIFTLISSYVKTALGQHEHRLAQKLFQDTGALRQRGFHAYCATLFCFVGAFIIMLPKYMGWGTEASIAASLGLVFLLRGAIDFRAIYSSASQHIYHSSGSASCQEQHRIVSLTGSPVNIAVPVAGVGHLGG